MRRAAAVVAAALLLGLGAIGAAAYLALRPASPSPSEIVVEIPRGSALPAVAAKLETAGVIRSARAFALLARLQRRADALGLPVETLDERWSSVEAERTLRETGQSRRKRRSGAADTLAATLLLRTFLERRARAEEQAP